MSGTLAGDVLRVRTLTDTCGAPHVITIVEPSCTPSNRAYLFAQEQVWQEQMAAQPPLQRHRGRLAVDTAYLAARSLCDHIPDSHILAAQDESGALRGLSLFYYLPDRQVWDLALHVRDPHDQGGSGEACQIRGVGSELLGADADVMASRLCTTVELMPLDEAAARFWRARGFAAADGRDCSEDDVCTLSCPGLERLRATYAASPRDDQDMLCNQWVGYFGRVDVSLHARAYVVGVIPPGRAAQ